jgi:hypothetical protein
MRSDANFWEETRRVEGADDRTTALLVGWRHLEIRRQSGVAGR